MSGFVTTDGDAIPPNVRAALTGLGKRIELFDTAALYTPLHPAELGSNVVVTRDAAYGPHERHRLDVFAHGVPHGASKPVLVYVPGGGFSRGGKHPEGAFFYDNVGAWAAREGLVGVTVDHRLAPAHPFPAGVEDLARLMAWLQENAPRHGGDPRRVFLWGHSAGAAHVADYLAHVETTGSRPQVAGAIVTSGFYLLPDDRISEWSVYYGEDITRYAERSSMFRLAASPVPLLVTDAELDPDAFRSQAALLFDARVRAGRSVRGLHLSGHTHLSETFAVGTTDRSLSAPVLDFIRART